MVPGGTARGKGSSRHSNRTQRQIGPVLVVSDFCDEPGLLLQLVAELLSGHRSLM